MSRNVTLAQFRTDIRFQSDQVGASVRHEDTPLNRIINQSIQRFRERVTISGDTYYLTSATATISSGAASTTQGYQTLDISGFSPNVVRTFGVDILYQGSVCTLRHISFDDRNDYGGGRRHTVPQAWTHISGTSLAIFPPPSSDFSARIYYCPVLADLDDDADTFDGVAGWEEYITWDVVCRLIVRDQYPGAYQMATDYRRELWMDIEKTAARASHAGGAVVGRDTMGERMSSLHRSRALPPP